MCLVGWYSYTKKKKKKCSQKDFHFTYLLLLSKTENKTMMSKYPDEQK